MGIGKRIKEARESNNLTQAQLASKIGVTPSSITNYENGTSHPKEKILYDLMNALSVDANFLFQDEIPISNENTLNQQEIDLIKKYRSLSENDKNAISNLIANLSNKVPYGYNVDLKCFTDVDGARAYMKENNFLYPTMGEKEHELSDDDICELATKFYKDF